MAYVKKVDFKRITFAEGHDLHGLEILSRPVQVAYLGKVASLLSDIAAVAARPNEMDGAAARAGLAEIQSISEVLFELFADKIKEWNFQMEGEGGEVIDVPPTVDGFRSIGDDQEVFSILNAWLAALAGVPVDLGKESSSGENSPELSALMEPLSTSLVS